MRQLRNTLILIAAMLALFPSPGFAASLRVSWNANTDADLEGYKVYQGTQPGSYGPGVDVGNVTSYQIDGLTNGTTYYVAVTAHDVSQNESGFSPEQNVSIPAPDTTPPTGSVVINSGGASTTSRTVSLTLSASDVGGAVTGMRISNDGTTYSSEIAYAGSYAWTLPDSDGIKTVYVVFKDAAGNWMSSPAADTIELRRDSDGDGMSDEWETAYGLNPNSPGDAFLDADSDGVSNLDEFLHSTNPTNAADNAPVVSAGPDRNVAPQRVILDGSATYDPNGDTLSLSWAQVSGPVQVLLETPASNVASFLGIKAGLYRFRLSCSDGRSTVADTVDVTIQNAAPSVSAGSDTTVNSGTPVTIHATGSDPNEDQLTYQWTKVSGPSVTLPSLAQQNIAFTPSAAGLYTFSVRSSDGVNTSAADQVNVTVNAVNHAPTANAGPDMDAARGSQVSLNGTLSTDPDGNTLSFSWSQASGPQVSLTGAQTAQPTFVASTVGTLEFDLTVSDGSVSSTSDRVVVRVTSQNTAPVAVAGTDMHAYVGDDVVLDASGSYDVDGDPVTFSWTQVSGASVVIVNPRTSQAFFTPTTSGVFELRVTVSDGQTSATDTVTVTVDNANQVPIANAGANQVVVSGATVTLNGSASSDPDGNPISYLWSQTGGTRVSLSSSNTARPTFVATEPGVYVFELKVYDGTDTSSASSVTVTVQSHTLEVTLLSPALDATLSQNPVLSWAGEGFSSYKVYVSINSGRKWQKIYTGSGTACSLHPAMWYWFIPSGTTVTWYVEGNTGTQVVKSGNGKFIKR